MNDSARNAVARAVLALWLGGTGCSPVSDVAPPVRTARSLTFSCDSRSVRAFDANRVLEPSRSMGCSVHVADGLGSPVRAAVRFLREAGTLGPDATTAPDGTLAVTHATGEPLPIDVEPGAFSDTLLDDPTHVAQPLAPAWMRPDRWNENPSSLASFTQPLPTRLEPRRPDPVRAGRTNNPRDGLVTLVALTDGEESFDDDNGNGTFDVGEPFVDTTEPFVDANDDGTWNEGETFADTNGNLRWDGRNGTWDHQALIWAQERVLWTGVPHALDAAATVPGLPSHRPSVARAPTLLTLTCNGTTSCGGYVEAGQPSALPFGTVAFYLSDPWFNELTRSDGDSCRLQPSASDAALLNVPGDVFALGVQEEQTPHWQLFTVIDSATLRPDPPRQPAAQFAVPLECTLTPARGSSPQTVRVDAIVGSIE